MGKDEAVDTFFICATAPDLLPCVGMMGTYTRLVPEKLIMDDDIIQSIHSMTRGIAVNSETINVAEIAGAGPGGHFLDTEYTLNNLRDLWNPGICHQWSSDTGTFADPHQIARDRLKWILSNHQPVPLDPVCTKALGQIVKSAQKAL